MFDLPEVSAWFYTTPMALGGSSGLGVIKLVTY